MSRQWTKLDSGSDDEATRPMLTKDSKSRQDKTKLSLRSHLDDRKERKLSKAFDEKYQAEFHPLYLQVQSALHKLQQRKNYEDQIWNTLENGSSILPCEDQVKEYNHSCKELEKEEKDLDSIRRQSFDRLSWTSPEWDFRNSEQGIDYNMNTFCKEFNLDNNTAKDTGEELHSGQILDTQIREYYKFILKSWEEREIDKLAKLLHYIELARDCQYFIHHNTYWEYSYKQNIQEYPKMTADIKKRVEDERSSKKTEKSERILIDTVKQLKQVEEKVNTEERLIKDLFEKYYTNRKYALDNINALCAERKISVKSDKDSTGQVQNVTVLENSKSGSQSKKPSEKRSSKSGSLFGSSRRSHRSSKH